MTYSTEAKILAEWLTASDRRVEAARKLLELIRETLSSTRGELVSIRWRYDRSLTRRMSEIIKHMCNEIKLCPQRRRRAAGTTRTSITFERSVLERIAELLAQALSLVDSSGH